MPDRLKEKCIRRGCDGDCANCDLVFPDRNIWNNDERRNGYMYDKFDNAMIDAGVGYTDISTKAYQRVKLALAKNPEIIIGENLGDAMQAAAELVKALNQQCGAAKDIYISDTTLKNAVASFTATLCAVQNTFGKEAMTEAVICKAIEAGSYIGYRAIMGEAAQPAKRY